MRSILRPTLFLPPEVNDVRGWNCPVKGTHLKRAAWAHQNCFEALTLHAPACLLCLAWTSRNADTRPALSGLIARLSELLALQEMEAPGAKRNRGPKTSPG